MLWSTVSLGILKVRHCQNHPPGLHPAGVDGELCQIVVVIANGLGGLNLIITNLRASVVKTKTTRTFAAELQL